ncbi:MAG: type II secretion system protein N, partial [Nitrospirota bacterium]
VLNVLLLAVIIALAAYILPPLLEVNVAYTLPVAKKISEEKEEKPAVAQPPSVMEYAVIAEQNVFNPERKIPAEKKDEKPLPKPEFVLYGTLIAGDTSMAFIEDLKAPYTTAGRGKRQRTLRVGGMLSGYTLSRVYTDRVVLVRGEERMEVRVLDQKKGRVVETVSSQQLTPPGSLKDKPPSAGRSPGIVHKGPPPPGVQIPDEKALSKVKGAFEPLIMKKTGNQQTEKPK